MTLKQRPEDELQPFEMMLGVRNRSSNQGNQSMASFTRDHSERSGVKSALLDEPRHAAERRKSPDPKGPRSGTDLEGNTMEEDDEEELTDDHEHDASSTDEGPPDNSS